MSNGPNLCLLYHNVKVALRPFCALWNTVLSMKLILLVLLNFPALYSLVVYLYSVLKERQI